MTVRAYAPISRVNLSGVGWDRGCGSPGGKKIIFQRRATTFVSFISSNVELRKEYDIAGGEGTYT